ncbi:MAG: serine hydrolase domain-containing protein [Kordiimonas sp.]
MKSLLFIATYMFASTAVIASQELEWRDVDSKQVTKKIKEGVYQTVTSALVMQDGKPIYEAYFNGADSETLHDTRSVTKTVMSMAVGAAIERGALPDQYVKVAPYFPAYRSLTEGDPRKENIVVEDLLTMSNPLECDDWNNFSRGNEERMYLVEDPVNFFWSLPLRDYPTWMKPPAEQPHGRAFSYCTAGVQTLGMMLSQVISQPVTSFVDEEIFAPAEISAFKWQYSGSGVPSLGGGLLLTTSSLAKLAELQRNGGQVGGHTVYSTEWSRASVTPKASIPPHDKWLYGYLWWLQQYEVGGQKYTVAAMSGNGGNKVWILPDFNLTVVLTKTDYGRRGMHDAAQAFFDDEIVARLR